MESPYVDGREKSAPSLWRGVEKGAGHIRVDTKRECGTSRGGRRVLPELPVRGHDRLSAHEVLSGQFSQHILEYPGRSMHTVVWRNTTPETSIYQFARWS